MAQKPIYPKTFDPYRDSRQRYAFLVGGAGSGKSYSAAQKHVWRCVTEPGARILVVRKVAQTLKRSCFQLCKDVISHLGLTDLFKALSTEMRIEHRENGAQLLFTGIDDPEKIKSIQGISSIWVEEATELNDLDFRQLELRLRGETPGYKQITVTCNPTDDESWVFTRFADPALPERESVLRHVSTYLDNPFLDDGYKAVLETSMADDENMYRIYTQGRWGKKVKKDLFYKRFDTRKHICADAEPDPELPLRLSFDFNVQPYITTTVWQVRDNDARQLAEVCLEGPRNTVPDLAAELLRRFGTSWPAGVVLYGDPNGRAKNVTSRSTPFSQLMDGLAAWRPTMDVPRAADLVYTRGNWINRLLGEELDGIRLSIAKTCAKTLADYAHVKEDNNGKKHKIKITPRDGSPYEPYGHCSDANDYLLCAVFKASYKAFKNGRKMEAPP